MSSQDKKEYRAVYCGLCHALGKQNGIAGIVCLNYEFTAFLLLVLSLQEEEHTIFRGQCTITPFVLVPYYDYHSEPFQNGAFASTFTVRYKLSDNSQDSGTWYWKLLDKYYARLCERLQEQNFQDTDMDLVKEVMEQYVLEEKEPFPDVQSLLHLGGLLLETLMKPILSLVQEEYRSALSHIAYLYGRWVCTIDAYDDYHDDRKKGNSNLLVLSGNNPAISVNEIHRLEDEIAMRVKELPLKRSYAVIHYLFCKHLHMKSEEILEQYQKYV